MNELCTPIRDLVPEAALGIAPVEQQARVLGHVTGCPECRAYLSESVAVADGVLTLVPPVEPPSGFESAVAAALGAGVAAA
ncbi:MAG: zf-HC2 domain-containing protein, partial [Micromonosporaceae bacterium]